MRKTFLFTCAAALATLPLSAQEAKPGYPAPSEIVAKAGPQEWVTIAPSDLMVMDLAPDAGGKARRVVIQLMPAPFSQDWVGNIRKLAAAKFWDNTSVNRVQDNYVVQWGDATEKKALPEGLVVVPESEYVASGDAVSEANATTITLDFPEMSDSGHPVTVESALAVMAEAAKVMQETSKGEPADFSSTKSEKFPNGWHERDSYANWTEIYKGWPLANYQRFEWENDRGKRRASAPPPKQQSKWSKVAVESFFWPVHCYGMVGVGRNLSPDTGTGAELYTVIGHAPRHLDRNIALVGRVIEGIEHLSSLPRGTGALGFYEKEEERVPILSVRIGDEIADLPAFEYLSTESDSFAAYADARANRRDPFFNVPAGGADICNIPVPIRRTLANDGKTKP